MEIVHYLEAWFSALWFWATQGEHLLGFAQVVSALITAFSTLALFAVTFVLAKYTKRLAEEANMPFVVCTLESSQASATAMQEIVRNTGNAPAFDIEISTTPPLREPNGGEEVADKTVSLLPPGRELPVAAVLGHEIHANEYEMRVSWSDRPKGKKRTRIEYSFSAKDGFNAGWTTKGLHQIADELQKIRNDWRSVSQGQKRLGINSYSSRDRETERREAEKLREEQIRKQQEKGRDT